MVKSVIEKARDGHYRSHRGVPARPLEPMKPSFNNVENIAYYEKIMKQYHKDVEQFQDDLSKYNAACQNLEDNFRHDIEEEFGMTNHPKRDIIFRLAMDRGRFSGKDVVYYAYKELMELL